MLSLIRDQLTDLIRSSCGVLDATPSALSIFLDTPVVKEHGDLSCNIALQLSKSLRRNPLEIADAITKSILRYFYAAGV